MSPIHYPGYEQAQTLAAMLDGSNPISGDHLLATLTQLAEQLPLNIQIVHPSGVTQSEAHLLGTKTQSMDSRSKVTYVLAGALAFQTLANIARYTKILCSFSNKLSASSHTKHKFSFPVVGEPNNSHATGKGANRNGARS